MRIFVQRAGLLTTLQDGGRWGYQAFGVPVSGAMDGWSHRCANLMLGNDAAAATLEVTGAGPELVFEGRTTVAVAGAVFSGSLDGHPWAAPAVLDTVPGSRLAFGPRAGGFRAYVAVAGGFAVPLVLGSRSTDLRSGLGGLEGRALRDGDVLLAPGGSSPFRRTSGAALAGVRAAEGITHLRVVPGPDDHLGPAFEALTSQVLTVSPRSDRMAYRLSGVRVPADPAARLSAPVAMGLVQLPPSGEPILLMAERQTTGGYPLIAAVISADLPLAGQLAPGDRVRFEACAVEAALAALIAREQALLAMENEAS